MVDETAPTERKPDNARQQQHAQQVLERFNEKKRREEKEVIVVDIHMPFWSMVTFMVKWSIASIPAILILVVLFAIIAAVLGGFMSHYPISPH